MAHAAAASPHTNSSGTDATPLRLVLAGSVCMLLFAALSTLVLAFFEQNIAGAALWTNGSLYQPGATGLAPAARRLVVPLAALP
ncbi:iron chelate uptake ABC transporter family permease subunit, partial [Burkholderia cenocepacia]